MQLDKETLAYLSANLSREVRENVEKSLFGFWAKMGAAFLFGVGLVGVPWSLSYIDRHIAAKVEERVLKVTAEPTEKAKRLADESQLVAARARDEVSRALAETEIRRKVLDETMDDMRAKSAMAGEKISELRGQFTLRASEIDNALKSARMRVAEIEDGAALLSDRVRNAVPDASLSDDVKAIVAEIARLDGELKKLQERSGTPSMSAQPSSQLVQLAQSSARRVEPNNTDGRTVYLQFAQMSRDEAKALSARLKTAGWNVPGEERLQSASGLREIRCFYDADCKAADMLKVQTETALRELGLTTSSVSIKPLLTFSPKPRQGILELWVGASSGSTEPKPRT